MINVKPIYITLSLFAIQNQVACDGKYDVKVANDPALKAVGEEPSSEYVTGTRIIIKGGDDTDSPPLFTADPSAICSSIKFYNQFGDLVQGTANCSSGSSIDENLKPENIKAGVEINGVIGSFEPDPSPCSADGELGCVADTQYPAIAVEDLAAKLVVGETLAGVEGTYTVGAYPACQSDGENVCISNMDFRAAAISGLADKILSGQTVAGILGNVSLPTENQVYLGSTFGVGGNSLTGSLSLPLESHVRASNGPYGLGGNGSSPSLADCAATNETGCVAVTDFPAFDNALLTAANIRSGVSIATVTGDYPSDTHRLTGSTVIPDLGLVGPATPVGLYEYFDSAGNRYEGTLADGGTITADTDLQSFSAANTVYRSFSVAGDADLIPANILTGVSIFGIDGEAVPRPNDCEEDEELGCVSVAAFPAADKSRITESNIRTGVAFGGVVGELQPSPADCDEDGELDCVAVAAFPAIDISLFTAADLRTDVVIGGVIGGYPSATHRLVNSTGTTDLGEVGPATETGAYEYFDSAGSRYEVTLADGGTIVADTDLQSISAANTVYRSFTVAGDADLLPANILTGVSIFGVDGAAVPRPDDCVEDEELGCVSVAAFPAADKSQITVANIRTGVEFGGVVGELVPWPADCADDGETGCLAVAAFPAVDKSLFTASDIRIGLEIGGVEGELVPRPADCEADADLACVTVADFPPIDLSEVSAENIRSGITIAGVTGAYPSVAHPLASHVGGSDDLTQFFTQLSTDGSFQFFDRTGSRYTGSGSSHLHAGNIRTDIDILGFTGNMPHPPTSLTANSGNAQIKLSWDSAGGADGYLVLVSEGTPVSFEPESGTSYALGPVGSDQVIYVGSATSYVHSGLANDTTYHYAIYSYINDNYYSNGRRVVESQTNGGPDCSSLAGSWVGVAGNPDYGTDSFCVMKFEAKNVGGVATSQAATVPWDHINHTNAKAECEDLGPGFGLPSNAEWMTMGTEIIKIGENWSGGEVGSGVLNRGNSDSIYILPASNNDDLGCHLLCSVYDMDCDCGGWHINKRTHRLASGEVIWDLAGNVFSWIEDVFNFPSANNKPHVAGIGASSSWFEFNTINSTFETFAKTDMIPLIAIRNSWNTDQGLGRYHSGLSSGELVSMRGGVWGYGAIAGIFAVSLGTAPDFGEPTYGYGFRCVYRNVGP